MSQTSRKKGPQCSINCSQQSWLFITMQRFLLSIISTNCPTFLNHFKQSGSEVYKHLLLDRKKRVLVPKQQSTPDSV